MRALGKSRLEVLVGGNDNISVMGSSSMVAIEILAKSSEITSFFSCSTHSTSSAAYFTATRKSPKCSGISNMRNGSSITGYGPVFDLIKPNNIFGTSSISKAFTATNGIGIIGHWLGNDGV